MEVVSLSPLRVASLVWQPRRGTWALTVVCKGTYTLQPGDAQLAREQEYPNEDDNHWNDDPARSLYSPSDLVPFKPRADVVLVGHAFAPRKEPARSVVARLAIGEIDKRIEVFGERAFGQDGQLREGARFAKMPLRWERAAGGPETANPVGVRLDGRADAFGQTQLPNLQPIGAQLASPKDRVEPVGFGPLAASWPSRRERLGRHAATFGPGAWLSEPIPEDLDRTYFNVAPRDQQLVEIRPNERLLLENLHPEYDRLVTSLPGASPRAFVDRRGAAPQEVVMSADTLWIDTDRALCTVTWRGQVTLEHPNQPGRVLVAVAEAGQRLAWTDIEQMARSNGVEGRDSNPASAAPATPDPRRNTLMTQVGYPGAPGSTPSSWAPRKDEPAAPLTPKVDTRGPKPRVDTIIPTGAGSSADRPRSASTLPFVGATGFNPFNAPRPEPPKAPPPPKPKPPRPDMEEIHVDPDDMTNVGVPVPGAALPFAGRSQPDARASIESPPSVGDAAPPWLTPSRISQPSAAPTFSAPPAPPIPAAVAPPLATPPPPIAVPAPPPPPMVAPVADNSPWAAGGAPRPIDPPPAFSSNLSPLATSAGLGPQMPPVPAAGVTPPSIVTPSSGGVMAASNAAASAVTSWSANAGAPPAPTPQPAPRPAARPVSRDVVELLWFEPKSPDQLRAHPPHKPILDELEPMRAEPEVIGFDDDAPPPEPPPEVKDRRLVVALLTRVDPLAPEEINEAIEDGVSDEGLFTPPIVLLSGELQFPFDELETLKATVTAVTPLVAGDKKLKETVDTVNELLKTPWLQSSGSVAEGLTQKVKEAFAQGSRMLPAGYLETHTERVLLEQRHYQRRTVFGEPFLRALFVPAGSNAPIPAYLPEPLAKQLPMFQRFRARIFAEAHLQQDQNEAQPTALKVIALGRVIALSGRRRVGGGS